MWMEKLSSGVLCILTPLGPRYIKPSFLQRVYLLWIFRHFPILPPQVLSLRQQRLFDALCNDDRYVAEPNQFGDAPVLGTLERRPVIATSALPPRRPSSRAEEAVSRLADGLQQRS
ncbi:MAG: hypothetical protein LAO03_02910 [Acidobacteriia bacterium]|nr:hypothetical protein [Terriglobia bacterium]